MPDLSGSADYADAVRSVYVAYAASHDADRYGDKTPPFVLHMELLAGLFPETRFVHVDRDGRDVARSLVQTSFAADRLARAAEVWQRRVTAGRASGVRLGPERHLEIRYESLVGEPAATLHSVCTFLELEFVDEMLHPEDGAMLLPEGERPHHANLERPVTPGLRDWRATCPMPTSPSSRRSPATCCLSSGTSAGSRRCRSSRAGARWLHARGRP